MIRKPKITSEGKVGALSRILAHRSSDWLGSGGQSRMKREEGEGEKEYCRNTCNYQRRQQLRVGFYSYPSRHRDIIINRCFFLFSFFSRLAAAVAQASRPCKKKKGKKKSLTSRPLNLASLMTDGEPTDRRKMKLVVPVLVFDYSLLSSVETSRKI